MSVPTSNERTANFLSGGGEMGALMRAHDWSGSPVGPPDTWPQSLRSVVGLMLANRHLMFVAWGPELIFLYNDGYRPVFGTKHPWALGRPFKEAWPEIWDDIEPLVNTALGGEATWSENLHLIMERNGYPENCWFTFSYSPVRDESGAVVGLFCAGAETTEKVLAERAQTFRFNLGERLRVIADPHEVMEAAVELLGRQLGADRVGYGEVQTDDVTVVLHSCFADGVAPLEGAYPLDGFGPAMIRRQREGLTQSSADVALDPDQDPAVWAAIDTRAFASVPLVRGGRFAASLYVNFREPHVWTTAEIALIEEAASRTWAATESARADAALRASEERLRLAIDNAELGFWDVDLVNDVLIWPAVTKAMFGISPNVPVTMDDFYNGLHPEDRERTSAAFAAAADPNHRALYDVEYRTIGKEDGVVRYVAAKGRGVFDANGRCLRVAGTVIDISERKSTEAALRESEALLRELNDTLEQRVSERTAERDRLWQNSLDMLAVVDAEGTFTAVNKAWTTALGWEDHELIGTNFVTLAHPDDVAGALAKFEEIFETPLTEPYVYRLRHKTGEYRWTSWTAAFEDGRVFANGRDVTLEKSREAELALAQDALRQSQKMEAMGQLTGGVAHDFNNLLTPIVGALDMLQRRSGLPGEREKRLIAGAAQSAERAKVLVQRLLAFARRQPLQSVAVDMTKLVQGMAELVASTVGPQIKVVVEAPAGLPAAKADQNQVEMALLNLAVNARDAMPDGGTLRISALLDDTRNGRGPTALRPGDYIRVSVADTGVGMDEATLARAVEPFFSTKGVGQGTGLGLSMVHGLASQLGGALSIKSKPGLGTTMELWLPVTQAIPEEAVATPDAALTRERGTALLVDDEELVRQSTAEMLTELGYRVVEATSAEEALMILENGASIDLILTDHLMPGITGVDLARKLEESRPDLPVVLISGYADVDGVASDMPRLTKPFKKQELASTLSSL